MNLKYSRLYTYEKIWTQLFNAYYLLDKPFSFNMLLNVFSFKDFTMRNYLIASKLQAKAKAQRTLQAHLINVYNFLTPS